MQWQANALNKTSINTAQRLGFSLEGVQRWQRVLPKGKEGNGIDVSVLPESTGNGLGPGCDSTVLAIYWDEWDTKRVEVVRLMDRIGE